MSIWTNIETLCHTIKHTDNPDMEEIRLTLRQAQHTIGACLPFLRPDNITITNQQDGTHTITVTTWMTNDDYIAYLETMANET